MIYKKSKKNFLILQRLKKLLKNYYKRLNIIEIYLLVIKCHFFLFYKYSSL